MKKLVLFLITLLFTGCANLNIIKIDKYSNVVNSDTSITVKDGRAHGKTLDGKSRIFANARDVFVGGLYVFELDRPLEEYTHSAILKECELYKCKKQEVKFKIHIDELDMKILSETFKSEILGSMSTTVEVTDLKGNNKRYALKAESQGLSYAASYPSIMRDLLEIILDDYSRNFVKNSVEWTEPVLK